MKVLDLVEQETAEVEQPADGNPLLPLVLDRATTSMESSAFGGIVIGELVAMTDDGRTPLVLYPGQAGSAAVAARSVVDLQGTHIGKQVVLVFEAADPARPVVMGVLRGTEGWPLEQRPGQVEVDVDGERLTVTAKEELVLRCGKASITLTRAGKVLIEGAYVSSRSSGVNRLKGGSVQLN
jgi:hypothetical protein